MNSLNLFSSFTPKKDKNLQSGVNAVIYTRVSHSSQEENTSLESQKKYCENYAERKGLNVIGYFGGTFESAKTDDRKEFTRMITFLKKTKDVSYILVYSYERFSRSGINGAQIADDLLKQYGIITLAVTQELDPRTVSGSFQQKIFFLFGQMDNEMRRDKTITGMRELVRKGYCPYSIPRGYVNLNKGKTVQQKIVLNDEGKILRKAFQWKVNENMANATIVRKLAQLGVKIDERRLGSMLANPFYCGIIVSKLTPEEVIIGRHEPMISQELFLKANNIVSETRLHPVSHNQDDLNLPLKRFMKCGCCEKSMTGFFVRQKGLYYYKCRTKGCHNNHSAKTIHEQFETMLSVFKIDELHLDLFKDMLNETYSFVFKDQLEQKKLLNVQLQELNKKIESIEERFVLGDFSKDLFDKYHSKYFEQKINLEQEIAKYSIEGSNLEKCIEIVLEICSNPLKMWGNATIEQKMILQNIIFPDGVRIDKKIKGVLTNRINSFFAVIPDLISKINNTKKGETIHFDNFSFGVTPEGF